MNIVFTTVITLGLAGFGFAVLLAFLSRRLHVEENPRIEEILNVLPGLNCGACGVSGCRAFAQEAVDKNSILNGCLPGGKEVNNAVAKILGVVTLDTTVKVVALCRCGAGENQKKSSFEYIGPPTCRGAHLVGGTIDCRWGCLGLGDCARVCPVGAITIKNKRVHIDLAVCIGCGKCKSVCPRGLFELVSLGDELRVYSVSCSNTDKGPEVRKVCSRGCIGCGICARLPESPYVMSHNLSSVDRTRGSAAALQEGMNKCPTKCIESIDVQRSR